MATRYLADAVLFVHFGFVAFVIGGLLLIIAGNIFSWWWVNRLWFRIVHLAAIALVVAESWLGITCPLTALESALRVRTGPDAYNGSFVAYWVQRALFYEAPEWVFVVAYTVFGLIVVAVWCCFPPQRVRRRRDDNA